MCLLSAPTLNSSCISSTSFTENFHHITPCSNNLSKFLLLVGKKQSLKSLVLWFLAHFISKYPPLSYPYVIHFCFNSKICCPWNISWEFWVRAIKWKPITEKENIDLQIEIFKVKMTSHQRGANKMIASLISPHLCFELVLSFFFFT